MAAKLKVAVFGAGWYGRRFQEHYGNRFDIVCFFDNNSDLWGTRIGGVEVLPPADIQATDFQVVLVEVWNKFQEIAEQLHSLGVERSKISTSYALIPRAWEHCDMAREIWVNHFARHIHDHAVPGSVAEAGVNDGNFSRVINAAFPDRKLYLFDTFSGFDERDLVCEEETVGHIRSSDLSREFNRVFARRQIPEILADFPNPGNCIVREGYFPDTARGIDERFCFVSLDMDLYKPILEGLRFFFPLIGDRGNGVVLVHDYYNSSFPGVEKAVTDFMREVGAAAMALPVGDGYSVAITKFG